MMMAVSTVNNTQASSSAFNVNLNKLHLDLFEFASIAAMREYTTDILHKHWAAAGTPSQAPTRKSHDGPPYSVFL